MRIKIRDFKKEIIGMSGMGRLGIEPSVVIAHSVGDAISSKDGQMPGVRETVEAEQYEKR